MERKKEKKKKEKKVIPFLGADVMSMDPITLLDLEEYEARMSHSFLPSIIIESPNNTLKA